MRRVLALLASVAMVLTMGSCRDQEPIAPKAPGLTTTPRHDLPMNPAPPDELAPATVKLLPQVSAPKQLERTEILAGTPILTPKIEATRPAGGCLTAPLSLYLPAGTRPQELDVVFCFDLTGSMSEELNNVKVNSVNIMTQLRALVPDSRFGVMSHMDYNGGFGGCDYGPDLYGSDADYPYQLGLGVSGDISAVAAAITSLPQGNGADGPEDYSRVLFESYGDPNIGWRPGALRILLTWLDAVPHDCNFYECLAGGGWSTGPDPGRDAVVGTTDDLRILDVLAGMNTNNITLLVVNSGGYDDLWQCYAQQTPSGANFPIYPDGTIPGGVDIATFIANLIGERFEKFDNVTLGTCDPLYSGWLTSLSPAQYTNVVLDTDKTFPFDIQLCVPAGTAPGAYCFKLCATGDGAVLAEQEVCITVTEPVQVVAVDIKPTSCPNPFGRQKGKLPVAILGDADLDVSQIDPSSVRLEGIPALRWSVEDVATPFSPYEDRTDCKRDCNTMGPDGLLDLTLKFDALAVRAAAIPSAMDECRVLHLTGTLRDGTPIRGQDVVILMGEPTPSMRPQQGGKGKI